MNDLNRSMGLDDAYPFTLTEAIVGKLGFVHETVASAARPSAAAGSRLDRTGPANP